MAVVPPTFVGQVFGGFSSTGTNTASVTMNAGEVVVLIVQTSDALRVAGTPSGQVGFNWISLGSYVATGHANTYLWWGTVPSTQTVNLTVTASGGNAGAQEVTYRLYRFSGSSGVGAAYCNAAEHISFTTQHDDSALAWCAIDWNVVDGASRTYDQSACPVTEIGYAKTTAATYYHELQTNVGAAGAKNIGITNPTTGTVMTLGVVEVLGDVTPPSQVTGVKATAVSKTEIDVTWNAATDNVGVASYTLRRDGAVIASGLTSRSYADTGLEAGTAHSYTVQAIDTSGNAGAQSTPATATTFPSAGSATGTDTWTGSAHGIHVSQGQAAGGDTWSGSAAGAQPRQGTATGTDTWSGTAAGATEPVGAASGGFTFTGKATGPPPPLTDPITAQWITTGGGGEFTGDSTTGATFITTGLGEAAFPDDPGGEAAFADDGIWTARFVGTGTGIAEFTSTGRGTARYV